VESKEGRTAQKEPQGGEIRLTSVAVYEEIRGEAEER